MKNNSLSLVGLLISGTFSALGFIVGTVIYQQMQYNLKNATPSYDPEGFSQGITAWANQSFQIFMVIAFFVGIVGLIIFTRIIYKSSKTKNSEQNNLPINKS